MEGAADDDFHSRIGCLVMYDEIPSDFASNSADRLAYMKRIVMIDHDRPQEIVNKQHHDPRDNPIKPEFANLPTPPVSPLQLPPALLD